MLDRIEQLAIVAADMCVRRNRSMDPAERRRLTADLATQVDLIAAERDRLDAHQSETPAT